MTPEEDGYLRALLNLLDGAEHYGPLVQENSDGWAVRAGSALADDDAKSHPHTVSACAWHALLVAVDHMQCLHHSLLRDASATHMSTLIHTHSQFSLIRGIVENAARAVWVLGPAGHQERLTRRLRLQAKEIKHNFNVRRLVGTPDPQAESQRIAQLVSVLVAAGETHDRAVKILKNAPSFADIVRDAGALTGQGADPLEVTWSMCSSLAHGDAVGSLSYLDREVMASSNGISLVRFTGSISTLAQATRVAINTLDAAFRLYDVRASAPA